MGDLCLICRSGPCQNTEREWKREREWGNWSQYFCLCVWVPGGPAFLNSEENDKAAAGSLWDMCVCDRRSHFEPFRGSVSAVERVVQMVVHFSMWVCARLRKRGLLLWNWVVNSLCLSADYSGMGLGTLAWENPPLSKIIQLWTHPKQL